MDEWWQQALTGAIGGAISYLVSFKFVGEKWLQSKFDTQIEESKSRLNEALDRKIKLHQAEYTALPAVWGKLIAFDDATKKLMNQMHFSSGLFGYLDAMSEASFLQFLLSNDVSDKERFAINNHGYSRSRIWRDIEFYRAYDSANAARGEFEEIYSFSVIYMDTNVSDKVKRLSDMLIQAIFICSTTYMADGWSEEEALKRYTNGHEEFLKQVENAIRDRIWN